MKILMTIHTDKIYKMKCMKEHYNEVNKTYVWHNYVTSNTKFNTLQGSNSSGIAPGLVIAFHAEL